MKIAIFHNLPIGGAKRTVYEQAKFLAQNHSIDLYQIKTKYLDLMNMDKFCDNVYTFDFELENNLPFFFKRLKRDYDNFFLLKRLHQKIAKHIDQRGYSAVLVHSDMYTEAPFVLQYLKTPNIYHCHELLRIAYEKELQFDEDVHMGKKVYEKITRKIRKKIDAKNAKSAYEIVTSSYYIANKVANAYSREAFTCHPGVDTKVFKPTKNKKNDTILFIGGKSKIKGYGLAKKAVQLANKKLENQLRLKVLGFGSADKLISNDSDLAKAYSKALITLCTSYSEPFGLSAIESMACKTPPLAVDEGGYRESIIDKKNGYLLRRSPQEFAEKIQSLAADQSLRNKMGLAGRRHVLTNFQWQKHGKCLEKALRKMSKKT